MPTEPPVRLSETSLSEYEALVALNQLRSNIVATQKAGWSDSIYPLVAILNAAGFEQDDNPTDERVAEHFNTYGGAGGFPGHAKEPLTNAALQRARESRERREKLRGAMKGPTDV